MSIHDTIADQLANTERELWRMRDIVNQYRRFVSCMQLDHTSIERALAGVRDRDGYKANTLANLRVWLDREGLKKAGYSEPAIRECAEWVRELMRAGEKPAGAGHD
jgi:hypothetical protein